MRTCGRVLICAIAVLCIVEGGKVPQKRRKVDSNAAFQSWKNRYEKRYSSLEEEDAAKAKVLKNLAVIEAHNERFRSGKETFQRGLWDKSDLTFEEKQKILTGSQVNQSTSENLQASRKKLTSGPNYVNWTAAGLVHEVEDQLSCGSCYAFAVVGVVEGVMLRKNLTTRLSVQQIVDCDRVNFGCNGGEPIESLKFVKNKGLTSAKSYPYTSKRSSCKQTSSKASNIMSVNKVTLNGDENKLKSYVATYGPVVGEMEFV
jgi:C1A family cysteine protease